MQLMRKNFAVEVKLQTESGIWLPKTMRMKESADGTKFLDEQYFEVAFASENCEYVKPGLYAIPYASTRTLTQCKYKGKTYQIYDENQMALVMDPKDWKGEDNSLELEDTAKMSEIMAKHNHDQVYNGPLTQKAAGLNKGAKKYYDR